MDSTLDLKRHTWKIYEKNHRLINCTNEPRRIPERNKEGYLPKTQTIYYELSLARCQYIRIPQEIRFFQTYRMFVTYSITLFDKTRQEYFGRTYNTTAEDVCEFTEYKDDIYLSTTKLQQLYFNLHDIDVDDTVLVVQLQIN